MVRVMKEREKRQKMTEAIVRTLDKELSASSLKWYQIRDTNELPTMKMPEGKAFGAKGAVNANDLSNTGCATGRSEPGISIQFLSIFLSNKFTQRSPYRHGGHRSKDRLCIFDFYEEGVIFSMVSSERSLLIQREAIDFQNISFDMVTGLNCN